MGHHLLGAVSLAIVVVGCYSHLREGRSQQLLALADNKPIAVWDRQARQSSRSIEIVGDDFMLDGQRLHIVSGSLHYFRTPAVYWQDRLRKLKAAGLNSVATYVEWSFHEPEERQYRFTGDHDVAAFVRAAAAEGLHVLLRPGPYICAERDLGGLPYWLLSKYPKIRLRTQDKDFMAETKKWLDKLFEQLKPLLYGNGGPIILVQVENEYGSYSNISEYKIQARDQMKQHVGDSALLYTTDGYYTSLFKAGAIPGTLTTVDFGADPKTNMSHFFGPLRKFMAKGPLMNSEYYPGWLTHWGEKLARIDAANVVETLKNMLDYKAHVNFYVFYGGTNFEFTAGANYDGTYQPDITSYDYDAPLSEAGDPTPKYYAIRQALEQYFPEVKDRPLPLVSRKGAYGKVSLKPSLELLSPQGRIALGKRYDSVTGSVLPTFETLWQRSGLVLYETALNALGEGTHLLRITQPRDRVYVFVDGKYQDVISRMSKLYELPIEVQKDNVTLSLLVENQGRINYGPGLHDFKGILSPVLLDSNPIQGEWTITGFPLENLDVPPRNITDGKSPLLYEGKLILPAGKPLDTYLNPEGWSKGYVWINGHNLGRYWPDMGPQVTLYVPGCWLLPPPATNLVQLLELETPRPDDHIDFIDHAILDNNYNFEY